MPTIASKDRCSSVGAGGSSSSGIRSRPVTTVPVEKPTRNESRSGILIAPLTSPSISTPPRYSSWPGPVSVTYSMAANFAG